jgi:hypothetical protein
MLFSDQGNEFQSRTSVGGVLTGFVRSPVETILRQWNWKSAVLSAAIRGSLFFSTNIGHGLNAAFSAMAVESAFYITTAGFYGAFIQAFRRATPAWAATATVMFFMPAINHTLEFLLHLANGTRRIGASVAASVVFSMFSAAFNLYAMRRGALIVGEGRQSLTQDLLQMPRIVFDFFTSAPRALWRILRRW